MPNDSYAGIRPILARHNRAHVRAAGPRLYRRGPARRNHARSNRSRFITLLHAATNASTNARRRIVGRVGFRQRTQLRVRTEDQVHPRPGPLLLAGRTIARHEHVVGSCFPLHARARLEQVHEEIVGQRPRPAGEHTELGPTEVRTQHTQPADENRHLRRGQRQELRPIDQQSPQPIGDVRRSCSCGTHPPWVRARRRSRHRSAPATHRCGPA